MATYFGFAVADSMFDELEECVVLREKISLEKVKERVVGPEGVISCVNKSHEATIDAIKRRLDIAVEVPKEPPRVSLASGDNLIVVGVRNLPRLTDRREYTNREIAKAKFAFSLYTVWSYTGADLDRALALSLST